MGDSSARKKYIVRLEPETQVANLNVALGFMEHIANHTPYLICPDTLSLQTTNRILLVTGNLDLDYKSSPDRTLLCV